MMFTVTKKVKVDSEMGVQQGKESGAYVNGLMSVIKRRVEWLNTRSRA
jgi:hypothetical protein